MSITILAISGSLRSASSNTILLLAAAKAAPANVSVRFYEGIAQLPHFNPDVESVALPASVQELRNLVGSSDGLLISSPEYAHAVPGSLKNALDWLVGGFEFIDKPVALLNPSPHSLFAHPQLTETVRVMSARVIESACITLPIAGSKLDADGIISHATIGPAIRASMANFCDAIVEIRKQ